MGLEMWFALLAALLGGAAGWWLTQRSMQTKLERRVTRATSTLREQLKLNAEAASAAQQALRLEAEQLRGGSTAQGGAALAAEKAHSARLEARLNLAYAELDRLREEDAKPKTARPGGFADTQVM